MEYNSYRGEGRHSVHLDFAKEFTWRRQTMTWRQRSRKYSVYPPAGNPYYLRLLFIAVPGAQSFGCVFSPTGPPTTEESQDPMTNGSTCYAEWQPIDALAAYRRIRLDTAALQTIERAGALDVVQGRDGRTLRSPLQEPPIRCIPVLLQCSRPHWRRLAYAPAVPVAALPYSAPSGLRQSP